MDRLFLIVKLAVAAYLFYLGYKYRSLAQVASDRSAAELTLSTRSSLR